MLNYRYHQGLRNNLYFWRDYKGAEIDCIVEKGKELIPIEIKSACTFSTSYFSSYLIPASPDQPSSAHLPPCHWRDPSTPLSYLPLITI
ncbi:MAG: DUF4143 domain-containing protein [Bacteroidales bacterium]|nr:DUF4143 domain-containing protein [Bacteroidales bacterium]